MGVDRIILLIGIFGVIENKAAPNASDGSTCGDFREKYVFVLTHAANQSDLLTDLVKSAQSAIVERSGLEGDTVQVVISPEDFTEFEKKSRALKVYRSHSLQCANRSTNLGIVETNTSRTALSAAELSEKLNNQSSLKLPPKTIKELNEKMCRTSSGCELKFENNLINASLSNNVEKSMKGAAPSSTIFGDSSSPRTVRASKTKKGKLKQKSKVRTTTKFSKGKTRAKPKERKKSAKENDEKRSAKKLTKADAANTKTTLSSAPRTSTQESWNKLMSLAAKSLTKSNNTISKPHKEVKSSIASRKLLSSASGKKKSSIRAKRPKTKNTGKPAAKTSASTKKHIKSSNRKNQQRKSLRKLQGRRKTFLAVNPKTRKKIEAKNRKRNRDSRELKISAETACIEDNPGKRSLDRLAKRDFSFRAPGGCTVIKISNSCDGDCSENNWENSEDFSNFFDKETVVHTAGPSQLFEPFQGSPGFLPTHPNQAPQETIGALISGQDKYPDAGASVEDAASPQLLPPLISPFYELLEERTDNGSMSNQLRQYYDTGYPWYKPFPIMPSFVGGTSTQSPLNFLMHRPVQFPTEHEEDMEEADNYDEDGDDYDDDDDEEENYEELEEDAEERRTKIPTIPISALLHSLKKNNMDVIEDLKGENEKGDSKDEDYDDLDNNYDEDEDDDAEDYIEESGNAGFGDEDDYNADED